MHNLCAALRIHTEMKHSRSVNCILIQTAVSRIRCKLIQYTQQCFTTTSDMAEILSDFCMCSEFVFFHCRKKKTAEISVTDNFLPSVNGPNPALCEASSSSGLCNVTEQIFNIQHWLHMEEYSWLLPCSHFYLAKFPVSFPNLFLIQGLITVIPLAYFTFQQFQLLLELRW